MVCRGRRIRPITLSPSANLLSPDTVTGTNWLPPIRRFRCRSLARYRIKPGRQFLHKLRLHGVNKSLVYPLVPQLPHYEHNGHQLVCFSTALCRCRRCLPLQACTAHGADCPSDQPRGLRRALVLLLYLRAVNAARGSQQHLPVPTSQPARPAPRTPQ